MSEFSMFFTVPTCYLTKKIEGVPCEALVCAGNGCIFDTGREIRKSVVRFRCSGRASWFPAIVVG